MNFTFLTIFLYLLIKYQLVSIPTARQPCQQLPPFSVIVCRDQFYLGNLSGKQITKKSALYLAIATKELCQTLPIIPHILFAAYISN